jgi:hypothetical protein
MSKVGWEQYDADHLASERDDALAELHEMRENRSGLKYQEALVKILKITKDKKIISIINEVFGKEGK